MKQFKIEKIKEDADFPKCPDCSDCSIILYEESKDLSNAQKLEKAKWDDCDHIFHNDDYNLCIKCGFDANAFHIPSARLMRCPKCGSLYHVEMNQ